MLTHQHCYFCTFSGSFHLHLRLKCTFRHELSMFPRCGCWNARPIHLCQALEAMFIPPSPTQGQICWQHKFLCWLFSLLITKMSASSSHGAVNTFLGLPAHCLKWYSPENKRSLVTPSLNAIERQLLLCNSFWKKKCVHLYGEKFVPVMRFAVDNEAHGKI